MRRIQVAVATLVAVGGLILAGMILFTTVAQAQYVAPRNAPALPDSQAPLDCTLNGAITTGDPLRGTTLSGLPAPSACGVNNCPGSLGGTFRYDTYTFANNLGTPQCVAITINAGGCGGNPLFSSAYLGSYNPNMPCATYLGDSGNTMISNTRTYSVTVPAGATFIVVVENYDSGQTCAGYTLNITGDVNCFVQGTPTPSRTPSPSPTAGSPSPTPTCGGPGTPGAWAYVSPIPTAVRYIAATSDGTYAYAAGGYNDFRIETSNQFVRYNPVANTWTALPPLPTGLLGLSLVYAPNANKVFVFGGADISFTPNNLTRMYDLATGQWSSGAAMPGPRWGMAAAYTGGKIYLAGGFNGPSATNVQSQLWEYDPLANTWATSRAALPAARGAAGAGVRNGHLYLLGGMASGGLGTTTVYDYDIAADTWTARTPLLSAVFSPGSGVLYDKIWVFGGGSSSQAARGPGSADRPISTATQIYDPATDTWTNGPSLNQDRRGLSGTVVGPWVIAVAGQTGNMDTSSVEVSFNPPLPCGTSTPNPPTATRTPTGTATAGPTSPTPAPATQTPVGTATRPPTPPAGTATSGPFTPTPGQPTATPGRTATASSTACALSFTDVPPTNAFYPFIRCLACRQIVSGYADGTFRWGADVTRGQLSKIIANAAGLSTAIPSTQQTFSDVSATNAFWLFVERLSATGAIAGYACGGAGEPCDPQQRPYFRPFANATRGQIAKIDALAATISDPIPTTQQTFEDVPGTNPFWLFIERLAWRQIISGYSCGGLGEPCVPPGNRPYFRWGANATRGQISKIAAQTFYPNCATPSQRR
jgi:N-acetylneuraminic acid mutarotase